MLLHNKIVEADKASIVSSDNVEIKLKLTKAQDSNKKPVEMSSLINLNPSINVYVDGALTEMGEKGIKTYRLGGSVPNGGGKVELGTPCLNNMLIGCELFLSLPGDDKTYIGIIESFKEIPKPFWSH